MTNKTNFGIKAKLLMLVVFAFVCCAGLAGYAAYLEHRIVTLAERLAVKRLPMAKIMAEIRVSHQGSVRYLWLAAANHPASHERKEAIARAQDFNDRMVKAMTQFEPYLESAEGKKMYTDIKASLAKIDELFDENIGLMNKGTPAADDQAKEARLTNFPPVSKELNKDIEALNENMTHVNQLLLEETKETGETGQIALISTSVIVGLAMLIFGFVFANSLSRQLMALTESVAQAGVQVSAASEQLSQGSQTLSTSSQEQASSLEQTAAALTEISGMVEANTKGAEQARDHAKEVHSIGEQTRKSMEELAQAMTLIHESNVRIEKIVKVIEEIGDKTEVIDEIVFKTQLSSFND